MIIWEYIADWNQDRCSDIEAPSLEYVRGFAEQEFRAGFLSDDEKCRDGVVDFVKYEVTDDGAWIELERVDGFFHEEEYEPYEYAY